MIHPVEMLDSFVKSAEELAEAKSVSYGMGSPRRAREVRPAQPYTSPNPASATTRPDLVESQKALPPPPVQ